MQPGKNVLAIQVLNHATDLGDILIRPELILSDDVDVLLDVRDPKEFETGTFKGARNVPINSLERRIDELPTDNWVRTTVEASSVAVSSTSVLVKANAPSHSTTAAAAAKAKAGFVQAMSWAPMVKGSTRLSSASDTMN